MMRSLGLRGLVRITWMLRWTQKLLWMLYGVMSWMIQSLANIPMLVKLCLSLFILLWFVLFIVMSILWLMFLLGLRGVFLVLILGLSFQVLWMTYSIMFVIFANN
ncbi:hypothetical protein ACS0TY_004495 [Phlomoides rotata]